MALVAAKCTNCGANIEVDVSKEAGNCLHCGTAFITEKVINNYNTYVTQNITNVFEQKTVTQNITNVFEQETILWSGQTSKLGGFMFAAKMTLFMVLLFEIIFVITAACFDIGLADKWKTFGVLQACLILPAVIFPVIYFQFMGFRYTITNERISFIFGMSETFFFQHKEIVGLKIKYALYERNKQFGTIKIKLREKRFRPFRNHLYSIREPEKVLAIIKSFIGEQTITDI